MDRVARGRSVAMVMEYGLKMAGGLVRIGEVNVVIFTRGLSFCSAGRQANARCCGVISEIDYEKGQS